MQKLEVLTSEATQVVALLKERRGALISAAVTGKIDVRNYVPTNAAVAEEIYEPA
jgi:type I restriction enzyme S subunit